MSDNSIKLNIHLMRLPDELIDYVILHELAHIRVKNHSARFYEYLSTLVPEPKTLRQKIKKYSPTRYM
jgi:predicted metal-dependent hydrolase